MVEETPTTDRTAATRQARWRAKPETRIKEAGWPSLSEFLTALGDGLIVVPPPPPGWVSKKNRKEQTK